MANDCLLLRALRNETVERPPVWMMRQAGRYMHEYMALKEKHGFLGLCRTPELAVEVTMQPIRFLDPDAAIIFSDIMIPVEAMGMQIEFKPGPSVLNRIATPADVARVEIPDVNSELSYVLEAMTALRAELTNFTNNRDLDPKALLGFIGAPWTLACYITEQGPYKHFQGTLVFAKQHPEEFHQLLDKLSIVLEQYALAQAKNGADAIQIFDTWAGMLSPEDYREFALPYSKRIFSALKKAGVPSVFYINGSAHLLPEMAESGADCISIDWRTSLKAARKALGESIVVQGNFDPTDLFRTANSVTKKTREMLSSWDQHRGLVVNLGHGILPKTPRENALAFVRAAKLGWTAIRE